MNIGIDANCLVFERAGVGKYSQNLIKNLLALDKKNHYFLYFCSLRKRSQRRKQILESLPQPKPKNLTIRNLPLPARWYEFLTASPMPISRIIPDKIEVFFAPYATGIPRIGFAKMAVMIHDLVFLRYPEHRGRKLSRYYLKRHKIAIANCQKIMVPSQSTKKDLIDLLAVSPKKIQVIYEAADERFKVIKAKNRINQIISRYFDCRIKYILTVGTLEPRKNLSKLIEAYSLLPHRLQQDYKLVLCGPKGWNNNLFEKTINNLNLKDKIILTGFVKDADLAYIYNKASVFVYPSLYEGFGLPVLEAMASGTPVIVANNSSLSEISGQAAILVDCQKEEEIAKAIKKVVLNDKLAAKMVLKGQMQAKKYSWKRAAKQTLELLVNL